ncbi:hypothetical protein QJS04_geneDACA015710 [Acorus gramineus]|uniref:Uncharacterized protein n=1 Tax=Acorus gramineus TaxID=55184 RepID=A0AAV9AM86_ACOGR|nr:hypothetical protein QJS04_geneDACA015710 [Acorus gramineus]
MIDLWEDIGPWANSTNARPVKFTYMIPNSLPRKYIVIDNDAKLLQIFKENKRSKKFILYVIDNEDEVEPSSAAPNSVAASEVVSQTVVGDQRPIESIVQACSPVVNHDVNQSPFQPPIEDNPHAMQIENIVSSDNDVDAEQELQFDVEDLDVYDILIHDEEQQSMSDDSVQNEEDAEGQGDDVLKVGGTEVNDSGSDSDKVKTLKDEHTCTSVNKVGNEMATSGWLANKFIPKLQKTPEGKLVPKAFKYVQHIVKDIGEYIVRRSSDVMAEVA